MVKSIAAAVLLALLLGSCGTAAGPWAMRIEYNGRVSEFSTNIYSFYLSSTKTRFLINMYTPFGLAVEQMRDMPELWDDEEIADEVRSQAEFVMAQMLAIAAYCQYHNLTLDATQRERIDQFIRTLINDVFGRSRSHFNNTLARFHINEDIFREIRRTEEMAGLVNRHLFDPETGRRPVPMDDMLAIYEATFARFKHIVIITQSAERDIYGEPIEFTEEQLEEIMGAARGIYEQIIASGNDPEVFEAFMAQFSAAQMIPQGYTVNDSSPLDAALTAALFGMDIGEVRFVEVDGRVHIMKRYALLAPEHTPDLTAAPGTSIAQTMTRTFQQIILMEELAPFIANVEINREETDKFSVRAADTMFDLWSWIGY